ncbi:MAG: formamidopyrimidine-DNA glycosylase [Gemmataceae bacterium]
MPELPEVETIVRSLAPRLVGRKITAVRVLCHKLRKPCDERQFGRAVEARVEAIARRGKWICCTLSNNMALLIHLGMTGRLYIAWPGSPCAKHVHWVMDLQPGGQQLRYEDARRFGLLTIVAATQVDNFFAQQLGPEPFALTGRQLWLALRRTRRMLKTALMDQRIVAGLGNIYSDEALFRARLQPWLPACRLSRMECAKLVTAIKRVLRQAIAEGGSSIRDYLDGLGAPGRFQHQFQVYARQGQPCRRCGQPIGKVRLGGRSCHYCPGCQGNEPPAL